MAYDPDTYYDGQIIEAAPGEHKGIPFLDIAVSSTHGHIRGRWWIDEDHYDRIVETLLSYGLGKTQIMEILDDASPLIGRDCRFKTKSNEYISASGERKTGIRIAFFVARTKKPSPPAVKTKMEARARFAKALDGQPVNMDPELSEKDDIPF